MKAVFLLLAIAFLLTYCHAEEMDIEDMVNQVSAKKEEINQGLEKSGIPEPLKQMFGNETINVIIEMENGKTETVGVETFEGKIYDVAYNGFQSPSMNVNVSEETIMKLLGKDSPMDALLGAIQSGEITVQHTNPVGSFAGALQKGDIAGAAGAMALGLLGLIQGIIGFFSGIFA